MSESRNERGPQPPDIRTKVRDAFVAISLQAMAMLTTLPEANAAVSPNFSTQDIERLKKEGTTDLLERTFEELKAGKSILEEMVRLKEKSVRLMEGALEGMKRARKRLGALAIEAKDMPDSLSQIKALLDNMDVGILEKEAMVVDERKDVEDMKSRLVEMERALKEIGEQIKLRRRGK